jgi:tripartite-type tricarboxylate transporter receptor subunit TctC
MRFQSRRMVLGLVAAWVVAAPSWAVAQNFPAKPVTIVAPFAAGGPSDTVARLLAEHMTRVQGWQVVVENVAGAGGTVAPDRVSRAEPDGYTILLHHSGLGAGPSLYANLKYDPKTSFETVGLINIGPMVILSKKGLASNTLKELIDHAKANGEKVTVAHAGVGSNSHTCMLMMQQTFGVKLTGVAYRGTGPAMNDLVGGQVDIMCDQSVNAIPQVIGGQVKAYAVLHSERNASIKDVPTSAEAGAPSLRMPFYNALYVPKGTPKAVIATLNGALQKAVADAGVIQKFAQLGSTPFPSDQRSPEAHAKFFYADMDAQTAMFKAAGVTPGQAQ